MSFYFCIRCIASFTLYFHSFSGTDCTSLVCPWRHIPFRNYSLERADDGLVTSNEASAARPSKSGLGFTYVGLASITLQLSRDERRGPCAALLSVCFPNRNQHSKSGTCFAHKNSLPSLLKGLCLSHPKNIRALNLSLISSGLFTKCGVKFEIELKRI